MRRAPLLLLFVCSIASAGDLIFRNNFEPATNPVFPGPGQFPVGCEENPIPGVSWHTVPSTYEEVFGEWPGIPGNWSEYQVTTDKFGALWFATGVAQTTGKFATETTGQVGGMNQKTIALTECPGDFAPSDPDCRLTGTTGQIWWRSGGAPAPGICELDPNTTYYVNVIFALPADLGDTECLTPDDSMPLTFCTFHGVPFGPWQ